MNPEVPKVENQFNSLMARTKSILFPNTETELSALFDKLQRAATNRLLTTGALAIHGAASALAAYANTIYFQIDGKVYTKAAADCTALAGSVTHAKFNVFVFTVNAAGTLKTTMGTEAATLGAVVFPAITDGEIAIGFVVINPTGTGNFVGGTTQLDDATVVPTAAYVDTVGTFLPELATL
jgi:hypothetical protein